MKIAFLLVAFLLSLFVISCSTPEATHLVVDEERLEYASQTEYPGIQKSELFVFVGEKVEVVEVTPPHGEIWFDEVFDAKYRVLESVYGEFEGNIIEFRVFDHYGYPPFAKHSHALLFVSKHKGKLYHEKYQYHTVYRTLDGRWAACGDPYLGREYHRKPFSPKPLIFPEPVTFDLAEFSEKQRKAIFVEPYFEIIEGRAVCRMGAFVDELFQINRDGVLNARGVGQ